MGRILGQLTLLADSFIVPEEALRLVPEPHYRREGGPPSLPPDSGRLSSFRAPSTDANALITYGQRIINAVG